MEFSHKSVLLSESINALDIKKGGIYVDCTTGGGGHSFEIAKKLKNGKLFCFDRDKEAIIAAKEKLKDFSPVFINENFSEIKSELYKYGVEEIDGALMDLGVSSYQLDNPERGFSFHEDAPLDMRMGGQALSAYEVVNEYEGAELIRILYSYGEEKYAKGIVFGILKARENAPIKTTLELAEIIKRNVPLKVRKEKNPCRKTFQAIRIEVNGELWSAEKGIDDAFAMLKKGGRLAVITFHSLEDRLVKTKFKDFCTGCTCPPDFPVCVCHKQPRGVLVSRKPIIATEEELAENNRSRSAKLRIIEKL